MSISVGKERENIFISSLAKEFCQILMYNQVIQLRMARFITIIYVVIFIKDNNS